jgi:hypothetical protein
VLSKEQLQLIEDSSWSGSQTYGFSEETAVAIAQKLAGRPQSTRWLPRMHHHHILVRHVLGSHAENARALIDEIESLLAK